MFRWEICFNNLSVTPRGLKSPPPPATNSMTSWILISGYATFKGLQLVVHMSYEHFDVISMVYCLFQLNVSMVIPQKSWYSHVITYSGL